ncbi:MAG: DNA primase [Deltaproteobacteria bacterium]|nr:DNA primase [Deltaproteobacteria bacterium]
MDPYQSAKEEIKRAADIAELIGQYVQLKKTGLNHVGLCPFHSEKDPSFTVSPSKQMFHCFGCKKGGDIFDFWMEYHKVPFAQAMRDLAGRYHVTLPERKMTPFQRRKMELSELLFKINRTAAEYFHYILTESEKGRSGRAYLDKRSVDKEIIQEFMLGYAPEEWDGLTNFLKRKKKDMDKAAQAGLIIAKKNGGYYDRFRGRVIFPIFNLRKQIVGFGGRVLDDSLPKYLNTPETPVFRKGELLYGLHSGYKSIRESRRAVIVEGYTDVLALKRHGFNEAVATLGTALTRDHIRKLKGYTKEAVVVFDADAAGKGAAIKSMPLFINEGLTSRVMVLPEGDDPDSFVNKRGLEGFLELLNGAMPMFEFYLDLKLTRLNDGIDGQVSLLKEILPVLIELNNDSQRSLYVRRLSERTGIAESIVLAELRNRQAYQSGKEHADNIRKRLSSSKAKRGDDLPLLNLLIHAPHTMNRLMNRDCKLLLSDPIVMEIFDSMYEIYNREGEITPAEMLEKLEGESTRERFREVMLSSPIYPDEVVEQAVNEFEDRVHKIKLSESINRAREQGDIKGLNQLIKK